MYKEKNKAVDIEHQIEMEKQKHKYGEKVNKQKNRLAIQPTLMILQIPILTD